MTAEEKVVPSRPRPASLIPWLVAAGALLLYGITLNHWVTLRSLPTVAKITGWDWHPIPLPWRQSDIHPLYLVLTCPFRVLPVAWRPVALNFFSAVCATLTLGLLAASVRLLPHDRTREQRQREAGAYSLLSGPTAFVPPLFAGLMLALQVAFWRNATAASVEMLNVLVFAALIFCVLKFRISQNDDWWAVFAFIYGLGVTDDWALIGFFPLFLTTMIWIKGVSFFNWRLIARLAGCGLAGLLLYLLIPALGSLSADRTNFLTLLHLELGAQRYGLRIIPHYIVLVAALPTLLPLIFAGIRWPSFEGELSAAGNTMTRYMFRALHVVFLLLALVMYFDYRYSPSQRLQEAPIDFLTFYYMGALCVGYYSGYVLLIFGQSATQAWDRRGALAKALNKAAVIGLWALAVAAPVALFLQNIPRINASRSSALADYSQEIIQELPPKPCILLSDDPIRTDLLKAAFVRAGKANNNILIDTASLQYKDYIVSLLDRYPQLKKWTAPVTNMPGTFGPLQVINYLYTLSHSNSIYYLHPSFGYYFEVFYLRPHGMIYQLQAYPDLKQASAPPLLTDAEIKDNADTWARIRKRPLASLPALAKLDPDASETAVYYSVALDWLGVDMQKSGQLKEAELLFTDATNANPHNFVASINKQYNAQLQKGDHRPIDSGDILYKALMIYHGLEAILRYNGPVDEPGLALDFGQMMAEAHNYRQAAILFERRLQLLPGDAKAELDMTKTYVDWNKPDIAIQWVAKLRANPSVTRWDVSRVEALAYYVKNDYPTAEKLMLSALRESPSDENRVAVLAEFYRVTAEAALREQKASEAGRRFTNALAYIDQQLKMLDDAHNASDSRDVLDTLLKKAEVEMLLKQYDASIATLGQIIEVQPKNTTAILNRAIAEVQVGKTADARADYKRLRRLLPQQSYLVDFGLAQVAGKEKDTPEEIRWIKRYLDSAPENTPEYQQARKRLQKLEGH